MLKNKILPYSRKNRTSRPKGSVFYRTGVWGGVSEETKTKTPAEARVSNFGGAKRDRTADLLHAMQALSQLSYSPNGQVLILRYQSAGEDWWS
jgi:hypothetical protein